MCVSNRSTCLVNSGKDCDIFEFGGAGALGPWWILDLIVVKLVNG